MGGNVWIEKAYQLEAKENKEVTGQEKKALDDINNFLSKKNYAEGKQSWEKWTDPQIQKIKQAHTNLEQKLKEMQTKMNTSSIDNKKDEISHPDELTTVERQETINKKTINIDNLGQEKGIVESISDTYINNAVQEIKENINNPDFSISIIWRSDENVFVEWPTSKKLITTYNTLINELRNNLPDQEKSIFKAPDKPQNWTEQEISNWLNKLLAQSRALMVLQQLKNTLEPKDFQNILNNTKNKINIEVEKSTIHGEDRWASILINKKSEWLKTKSIYNPKSLIESKERYTNNYKAFVLVKWVPNWWKNTKDIWFNCSIKHKVWFDKNPTLDYEKRTTSPDGATKIMRSGWEEVAKNYIMTANSILVSDSTQEIVTTTTNTGRDINGKINTYKHKLINKKNIPGQKIILNSIDFSQLIKNKEWGSTTKIIEKLSSFAPIKDELKNKTMLKTSETIQQTSETLQP